MAEPEVTPLERLVAHDEIRMLAHRYALALDSRDLDSRDLDTLVALFVPDVQIGAHLVGREALKGFFDRTLREVGVTVLQVGGHVIDLEDADHATGTVYCRAGIQHGDTWVEQAIAYLDTYRRVEGHWLSVRRDHHLFYGVDSPTTRPPRPPVAAPSPLPPRAPRTSMKTCSAPGGKVCSKLLKPGPAPTR